MTRSDTALVAAAAQGDARAYEELLRRHFRAVYLVTLAIVVERADAEDVCQDAFIRGWERMRDCQEPERVRAWLCSIARRLALNHVQRSPARRTVALEAVQSSVAGRGAPAAMAERAELTSRLEAALNALSPVQRQVVLLHDVEGLRHAEVAAALDLSVTMSRRHLSDARRSLREMLGPYDALEPDHD
jgi:RNA polymerase sigma-70 factor (ECF subfamily)